MAPDQPIANRPSNGDFRQLSQRFVQNSRMVMKIVPADATVAELEKKAAACEEKAKQEAQPEAARLREEALLYREWIAALQSGKWHS